ncbi:MAG TPA: haloperoxidase, partial [Cyclobacteriaceae bacterium]|nr:haloperoxidase [Cyclobacteriaceae bacterium]
MLKLFRYIIPVALIAIQACSSQTTNDNSGTQVEPVGKDNLAYKWGEIAMDATANDTEWFKPRPTVTSRFLGLIWTAVFDAWSRYDEKATPIFLANVERRPADEQVLRNKEIAISYAAYRTMMEYYFSDSLMLRKTMTDFGFDP